MRRNQPELLKSAQIVALSLSAWLMLRGEGFRAWAIWEFLTQDDLREILIDARQLSRIWHKPCREELFHEGIDLGELVRIDNLWFFRELAASERAARNMVKKFQTSEAYIFSRQTVPCLGWHRGWHTHDVCEAALLHYFTRAGVKVRNLARIDKGRFPFIPLRYKQAALKAMKVLIDPGLLFRQPIISNGATPNGNLALLDDADGRRLILAIGEEVDLLQMEPLVDVINDDAKYRAVLVNTEQEAPSVKARSGISTISPDNLFPLVSAYPDVESNAAREQISRARRRFEKERRANASTNGSALYSGLLDFHFSSVWKEMATETIPHINRLRRLFEERSPDGVLVADCGLAKNRATAKLARRFGIPTLAIAHGYVGDVDVFDFETDYFLAWGRSSRKCLIDEFGKDPDSIKVLGPIHLNKLKRRRSSYDSASSLKRLLVITNRVSPVCFEQLDPESFEKAWLAMADFLKQSPNVEMIIKPHPAGCDQLEWYERLCADLSPRARIERARPLEEIVDQIDAAVAMTDMTTAVLVAQLFEIPTLFIRVGWKTMTWAVETWGGPDGLETIEKVEDISLALNRILFDEEYRSVCLERGRKLLEDNIAPPLPQGYAAQLLEIISVACGSPDRVIAKANE